MGVKASDDHLESLRNLIIIFLILLLLRRRVFLSLANESGQKDPSSYNFFLKKMIPILSGFSVFSLGARLCLTGIRWQRTHFCVSRKNSAATTAMKIVSHQNVVTTVI